MSDIHILDTYLVEDGQRQVDMASQTPAVIQNENLPFHGGITYN